jgi:hypothetical protein
MMIDLDKLPTISAIYRVWHKDHVVYVGQAKNLKQRWKNHHKLHEIIKNYGLDWTIDWVEVAPENLDRAEAFSFRYFRPKLNYSNPSNLLGKKMKNF